MLKIGRRDYVQLPQLGLFNVQAKIDTGAYGCSLHCHDIGIVNVSGDNVLRFRLLDPKHPEYQDDFNYVKEYNDKIVKNSGGSVEHRYTITSALLIFGQTFPVEFSLTDRANMRYPILLGRKFLRKRFVVDVSLKNLSKKKKHITI
jgi:hypothetical protein